MLLAMIVWFLAVWWFMRLLGRATGKDAPQRPRPARARPVAALPDPPDDDSAVRRAEADLVRQRLAGRLDATVYQQRMAALATDGQPSPPRSRGPRQSGR